MELALGANPPGAKIGRKHARIGPKTGRKSAYNAPKTLLRSRHERPELKQNRVRKRGNRAKKKKQKLTESRLTKQGKSKADGQPNITSAT